MSGGAYDYAYTEAPRAVRGIADTLAAMAASCAHRAEQPGIKTKFVKQPDGKYVEAPFTADDYESVRAAAARLRLMAEQTRAFAEKLEAAQPLLLAVEWADSGDWATDDIAKAMQELEPADPPTDTERLRLALDYVRRVSEAMAGAASVLSSQP